MNSLQQAYTQGFMDSCTARGIDPEGLVKGAQMATNAVPAKAPAPVWDSSPPPYPKESLSSRAGLAFGKMLLPIADMLSPPTPPSKPLAATPAPQPKPFLATGSGQAVRYENMARDVDNMAK